MINHAQLLTLNALNSTSNGLVALTQAIHEGDETEKRELDAAYAELNGAAKHIMKATKLHDLELFTGDNQILAQLRKHTSHTGLPRRYVVFCCFFFGTLALGAFMATLIATIAPAIPLSLAVFVSGIVVCVATSSSHAMWPAWFEPVRFWEQMDPPLLMYGFLPALVMGKVSQLVFKVQKLEKGFDRRTMFNFPGVLLPAVALAFATKHLLPYNWPWPICLAVGAMLSATDCMPFVHLFDKIGASPRLQVLIAGESIQNDLACIVTVCVAMRIVLGSPWLPAAVVFRYSALPLMLGSISGVGGLTVVAAIGKLSSYSGPMIQLALTMFCAYAAFVLPGSRFSELQVITFASAAFLVALVVWPPFLASDMMRSVWETLEFMGNTFIMFISGVLVTSTVMSDSSIIHARDVGCLLAFFFLTVLVRAVTIGLLHVSMRVTGNALQRKEAVAAAWSGGLKGSVTLALAIIAGTEPAVSSKTGSQLLFFVVGIAGISSLTNALLTEGLVKFLGLAPPPSLSQGSLVPMSHYFRYALHSLAPPDKPTWLYTTSRRWSQNTLFRSIAWFSIMVPLAGVCVTSWKSVVGFVNVLDYWVLIMLSFILHAMEAFVYLLSPWPDKATEHKNDPAYLARIGCLVPCHKSAEEIADTVRSLLVFLKPEHIVVIDNGNSVGPLDETRQSLMEVNPRVQYMWVPIGHKANALWMGLSKLPREVEFVMHIDDDTELPPDFVFDERSWDHEKTTAISYGIVMKQTGQVEKLVDMEFKQISQYRLFQSDFSTVWFQHGIIGLWRREAFLETLKDHPFLPFGEDNWNGTINLLKNRQMRQELRSCASTYAPGLVFPGTGTREQGYGAANLWKQRAERWCVNAPRRFFLRLWLLVFYRHDTLCGNLVFRLISIGHLSGIVMNLLLPCIFVYQALFHVAKLQHRLHCFALHILFGWLKALFLNYYVWGHRKDIQVDLNTVLLWPFYETFLMICTWYGHWRCLFYYIPFFPMRHGLYTEGAMTPELLDQLHNIKTVESAKAQKRAVVV